VAGAGELDAVASILSMVLFFGWDAQLVSTTGEFMVTISHDEWLELRAEPITVRNEMVLALQRFGLKQLSVGAID
jgi:hypothetical protein